MLEPAQFPFVDADPALRGAGLRPYLPITLARNEKAISVSALADTGAAINVLPHDAGLQLGAEWEQLTVPLQLTGNLASLEARALMLRATVGSFPAVDLLFAWVRGGPVPLILGQVNFFMEFDVCFFRSRSLIEVRPKQAL